METYFETVEELKKHDPELANQLLDAIVQYWLYGTEPDNPLIKALLIQIQYMIDTWKEISQKNSENGKKGWRPKKSESQTKPTKTKTNESEKNPKKANETEWKQNKNKKEKENNISLSNDNESASTFWDEEINECLEIIKSYNNGIINGSAKQWRQYANHLIKKLKNIENVKDGKIKRRDVLKMVLEVWKNNEYHSTKTTSPELIYYNLSTLMELCRKQFKKQQQTKVFTAL